MNEIAFDGGLSLAELIAIECIIEDLPKETRDRFIKEYKEEDPVIKEYKEEDPEEWAEYCEHRKRRGLPKL